ncbi:DUF2637 domain-containing protein [Streptomyces malaysiensis]|uniref:DUF2637 domain-containing protein n=1 Tax=Streptomyces malaysiensis TaxID=92644 RepID=UPI000BFF2670|nr:DUF2637 domain-containing protein [Streptomyces malaysiensis]ATL80249.1 putative membrane protein [Streptomyces malaysiensis]
MTTSPPLADRPTQAAVPAQERGEPGPGAGPAVPEPVRGGGRRATSRLLIGATVTGALALAAIGFTGSYTALRDLARRKHFGQFADVFPIGIDAGILVLLALDFYLTRRRTPLPLLRWIAHGLTLATIVFNAAAAPGPVTADPLGSAMHGVIPVLFIAAVEAARRAVGMEGGESTSVPLSRWLLNPLGTAPLWRRMKLWDKTYDEALALEKERVIYRMLLAQKHGRLWRRRAEADELLPIRMARLGVGVEEALEIPGKREEADRLRDEKAEQRKAEEADARELREAEAEVRRAERAARIKVARANAEAAEIEAEGRVGEARANADSAARTRLQETETRLRESEATAEAAAEAAANRIRRQDEKDQLAWDAEAERLKRAAAAGDDAETAKALAEKAEADTRREKAEAEAAEAAERASEARLREAENDHRAAEHERTKALLNQEREEATAATERARREAAEDRERAAEANLRAAEMEDAAGLSPVEREVRRLARMLQERPEMTLQEISDAFGLGWSPSTASERRKKAIALLERNPEGVQFPLDGVGSGAYAHPHAHGQ